MSRVYDFDEYTKLLQDVGAITEPQAKSIRSIMRLKEQEQSLRMQRLDDEFWEEEGLGG